MLNCNYIYIYSYIQQLIVTEGLLCAKHSAPLHLLLPQTSTYVLINTYAQQPLHNV